MTESLSPSRTTTLYTVACSGAATEIPNLCGWVQLLPAVPFLEGGPTADGERESLLAYIQSFSVQVRICRPPFALRATGGAAIGSDTDGSVPCEA